MGLGWHRPAIAHLKPGQRSTRHCCKAPGRGVGTLCATAHACWCSITLVVKPSEGLGCSYHHLMSIHCPRKPSPCGSLWRSPGRRREKGEKSRKGKPTADHAPGRLLPALAGFLPPGADQEHGGCHPPMEETPAQPGGRRIHLTWLLPAQPAVTSSELHCSDPERQPDCSGGLG